MTRGLAAAVVLAIAARAGAARADSIVNTPHNLSVSGPGPVRATIETQVCVFCHTPHDSNPAGPLWNHKLSSGVTYIKYTSPTMVAYTSQASAPDPNGSSKLCLSCHDGTVALGAVESAASAIPLQGGKVQLAPGDTGYLGTDLSRTHPISFIVTDQIVATNNATNATGLALNAVAAMRADPDVHLDALDRVQCTSCHDPHSDANYVTSGVHFYKKPLRSDPCLVCHASPPADMGPHVATTAGTTTGAALVAAASPRVQSSSQASTARVAAASPRIVSSSQAATAPVPAASQRVVSSSQGGAARALAAERVDAPASPMAVGGTPTVGATPGAEQRGVVHGDPRTLPLQCMSCHVGHGATGGGRSLLPARDEEACYRCHGPASAQERREGRLAPDAAPVNLLIEFQKPSHHPIEFPGDHKPNERLPETNPNARRHVLCVDCHDAHGTLARQPPSTGARARAASVRRFSTEAQMCLVCHGPAANRPAQQPDVARQFSATSYHPVLGLGRGSRVPSLVPPLTTSSIIGCSDCHGNDDRSGPAGPHGSIFSPLLVRNYQRDDLQPESPARYDLCYRCHDRNSILSDVSFPLHRKHVVEQRTPCAACHSAHGADAPSLVEFDQTIVRPNAKGIRAFNSSGSGGGQCYLSCHGADHDPESYCGPGLACAQAKRAKAQLRPIGTVPAPESLFPGWPGP